MCMNNEILLSKTPPLLGLCTNDWLLWGGGVIHAHFWFKHERRENILYVVMYSFKWHLIRLEGCRHKIIMPTNFYSVLCIIRELC